MNKGFPKDSPLIEIADYLINERKDVKDVGTYSEEVFYLCFEGSDIPFAQVDVDVYVANLDSGKQIYVVKHTTKQLTNSSDETSAKLICSSKTELEQVVKSLLFPHQTREEWIDIH